MIALNELPDLAANASEHFQQGLIRVLRFAAEKLDHTKYFRTKPNRKSKGGVQSRGGRRIRTRKAPIPGRIRNPKWLTRGPDLPRQAAPSRERTVSCGFKKGIGRVD